MWNLVIGFLLEGIQMLGHPVTNYAHILTSFYRLHRQIMDIGGTKLKAAESRINLVQTQIDQITGHITRANVAVKTAKR